MSAIIDLQAKCEVTADGVWGPTSYKAARDYFKLSDIRAAHFFGQCYHETGGFKLFSENLNYSADGLVKTFKRYFPTIASTNGYARNPQKIANRVYANRLGNNDEDSGDGWLYRGRGAIQLTGKTNYFLFSTHINRPDVMTNPDIVESELAFESALFFFGSNNLWSIADKGLDNATITALTKRINGGTNGLTERIEKTKQFSLWI